MVDISWRVADDHYFSKPEKRAAYVSFLEPKFGAGAPRNRLSGFGGKGLQRVSGRSCRSPAGSTVT